ncbi:hypothetical protein ACVWV7_003736 [Aeromonas hydrophila]
MNNGFIYPFLDIAINILKHLNLVELFKKVAQLVCKALHFNEQNLQTKLLIKYSNLAIDIYQIFKWMTLFYLWLYIERIIDVNIFSLHIPLNTKFIAWYLIASNLFTYFYYHVWGSRYTQLLTRESMNRRFMNTILAIAYYIFAYAYLFEVHYMQHFEWADNIVSHSNSIYLSASNALTFSHDAFDAKDSTGRFLLLSQAINTFIFLTIIISNSIPNHFKENQP